MFLFDWLCCFKAKKSTTLELKITPQKDYLTKTPSMPDMVEIDLTGRSEMIRRTKSETIRKNYLEMLRSGRPISKKR